jgi:hypothetical protein
MRIQEGLRCAFISGIALGCAAQTPKVPVAPAPSGVVTGHVVCADTQRPGRFAEVALLRKPDYRTHLFAPETDKPATESKVTSKSAPQVVCEWLERLDGSYVIRHVPPGEDMGRRWLGQSWKEGL